MYLYKNRIFLRSSLYLVTYLFSLIVSMSNYKILSIFWYCIFTRNKLSLNFINLIMIYLVCFYLYLSHFRLSELLESVEFLVCFQTFIKFSTLIS